MRLFLVKKISTILLSLSSSKSRSKGSNSMRLFLLFELLLPTPELEHIILGGDKRPNALFATVVPSRFRLASVRRSSSKRRKSTSFRLGGGEGQEMVEIFFTKNRRILHHLLLQSIIRETQVKIFRNKADCHELTFDQYLNVMMQVSCFAYPHLQHMPVSFSLNSMLLHFRKADEKRGINTLLYDDPDAAVFGDSDVIKEFNKILEKDPDYQLPEVHIISFVQ